jgi:hypothetical protein
VERSHGLITKRVELEGCLFPAGGEEMAFEKDNMPACNHVFEIKC